MPTVRVHCAPALLDDALGQIAETRQSLQRIGDHMPHRFRQVAYQRRQERLRRPLERAGLLDAALAPALLDILLNLRERRQNAAEHDRGDAGGVLTECPTDRVRAAELALEPVGHGRHVVLRRLPSGARQIYQAGGRPHKALRRVDGAVDRRQDVRHFARDGAAQVAHRLFAGRRALLSQLLTQARSERGCRRLRRRLLRTRHDGLYALRGLRHAEQLLT